MDIDFTIQKLAISAIPLLFAITLHEAFHAYAAKQYGDLTAYHLGRVSLNPLRHIDWIGTILLPALSIIIGGIIFGYAKPVPVNFTKLHQPKRDMMIVAFAGPVANFVMALAWALLFKIDELLNVPFFAEPFALMCTIGIQVNITLFVLNLLPILPLDGGRILYGFLPNTLGREYAKTEPYGFFIIIGLLALGILDKILLPFIRAFYSLFEFIIN